MIRRDTAFWARIANHPAVAPYVMMGHDVDVAAVVRNERNLPLASENGGIVFVGCDPAGQILEVHTLFSPSGRGREAAQHAKVCADYVFQTASLLLTYEQEDHRHTSPPRSHGWRPCGPFNGRLRLWALSRESWLASPVGRKLKCH